MQTKKINLFLVEVYNLKTYNSNENGFKLIFDYNEGHFKKVITEHLSIHPGCFKKTYSKKISGVGKLNRELGVSDYTKYFIHDSLNKAIKGARCISEFRNLSTILIVKKIN